MIKPSQPFIPSDKTKPLQQSGIRAASKQCQAIGGINLGQGLCDIPMHDRIKAAASQAVADNKNLYSACEGILPLREAIATKLANFNHINVDATSEVMVSHGATGAFVCAVSTLCNPGDEVILFEPFYGYHKNILAMFGVKTRVVPLNLTDLSFSLHDLKAQITPRTRAIVICTPANPSGKVFTKAELTAISKIVLAQDNLYVITDEMYEYITYPGHQHVSIASLNDAIAQRTVTMSGLSKTYNMTGWRLGYAAATAPIIAKMALVQDLFYVCPATPLQHAAIAAFQLDQHYYTDMQTAYLEKRDMTVARLQALGFTVTIPQGAYYVLADFRALGFKDDIEAANYLLHKAKVATVTGRSFYLAPAAGRYILRICFALDATKINQALMQLEQALVQNQATL